MALGRQLGLDLHALQFSIFILQCMGGINWATQAAPERIGNSFVVHQNPQELPYRHSHVLQHLASS